MNKDIAKRFDEKLVEVMESKVDGIIGEDGLTVWDFAELRDSIKQLLAQELATQRKELRGEVEGMKKEEMKKDGYNLPKSKRNELRHNKYFNQALDQVSKLLEDK